MPRYVAVATILLMMGFVLTRIWLLGRQGTTAMHFGKIDKTDFLLPPFVLFYFYLIFAHAFGLPSVATGELVANDLIRWIGVGLCGVGLGLLVWSLSSFGRSFRVGIDQERPDALVTTGVFAISRNPIYVAFASILLGQFLIFSNVILLVAFGAAVGVFHRQVLREEEFLKRHYGPVYAAYCARVRRYL